MDRCEPQDCYITLKLEALDSLSKVVCEDDPSLAAALDVIFDRVAPEVQRIIAGKNTLNAVSLVNLVKDILIHLHLRQASLTRSDTFKYWDYVSALLSVILDLKLLLVHVSESRKELRRAVLDLCFHLNLNRHQVWDAIVYGRCMKKKSLTQYLPEVVDKLVSWCRQKFDEPSQYLKFVVVVSSTAKCAKVNDEQRKKLKKALASFETKFDFHEWFFCQSFSDVVPPETCPTAKKLLKFIFEGDLSRHQLHSMCVSLRSGAAINRDLWRDDSDMFFIDNRRESVSTDVTSSIDALEGSLKSLETLDDASHIPLDDIVDSETVSSSSELAEDPVVFLESYLSNTQVAENQSTLKGGEGDAVMSSPLVSTPKKRKSESYVERENGSSHQTAVDELRDDGTAESNEVNNVCEEANNATLLSLRASTKKQKRRRVSQESDGQKQDGHNLKVSNNVVLNEAVDQLCEEYATETDGAQNEDVTDPSPSCPHVTKKQKKRDRMTSSKSDIEKHGGLSVDKVDNAMDGLEDGMAGYKKSEIHGGTSLLPSCAVTTESYEVTKKRRISSRSATQDRSKSGAKEERDGAIDRGSEDNTAEHKNATVHVDQEVTVKDIPVAELLAQGSASKTRKRNKATLSRSEVTQHGCSDKDGTRVLCAEVIRHALEDDTTKHGNVQVDKDQEEVFEANNLSAVKLSPEVSSLEEERRNRASVGSNVHSKCSNEEFSGMVHIEAIDNKDEDNNNEGANAKVVAEEMMMTKDDGFETQQYQASTQPKRERDRTISSGSDEQKPRRLGDENYTRAFCTELNTHTNKRADRDHDEISESAATVSLQKSEHSCSPDAIKQEKNEDENNFADSAIISQEDCAKEYNINSSVQEEVVATEKVVLNTAHEADNALFCDKDASQVNDDEKNLRQSSRCEALEISLSHTKMAVQDSDDQDGSGLRTASFADITSPVQEEGVNTEMHCTVSHKKLENENCKSEDFLDETVKCPGSKQLYEEKCTPDRTTTVLRRSTRLHKVSKACESEEKGRSQVESNQQESKRKAAKNEQNTPPSQTLPLIKPKGVEVSNDPQDQSGISNQDGGKCGYEPIEEREEVVSLSRDGRNGNDSSQSDEVQQGKNEPKQFCLSKPQPVLPREITHGAGATDESTRSTKRRMSCDQAIQTDFPGNQNCDSLVQTVANDGGLVNSSCMTVEDSDADSQRCYTSDSKISTQTVDSEGSSVPVSQLHAAPSYGTPQKVASQGDTQSASQGSSVEDGGDLTQISAIIGYGCEGTVGLPQRTEAVSMTALRPKSTRRSAAAARTKMEEVYSKFSQRWKPQSSLTTIPNEKLSSDMDAATEEMTADRPDGDKGETGNDLSQCQTRIKVVAEPKPSIPEDSSAPAMAKTPAKVQGNVKRATLTPTHESKVILTRLDEASSSPTQPLNVTPHRTEPENVTMAEVNPVRRLFSDVCPAVDSMSPRSSRSSSPLCAFRLSTVNVTLTQDTMTEGEPGGKETGEMQKRSLAKKVAEPSTLTNKDKPSSTTPVKRTRLSLQVTTPVTRRSRLSETPAKTTGKRETVASKKPGKQEKSLQMPGRRLRQSARLKALTPGSKAPQRL